ncbi:GlxA family transcriptional regulator [Aliiroseovarius crassostreae]|nr:GlxA family transcriptional regulator [Aliiroseovarius crassostreae]
MSCNATREISLRLHHFSPINIHMSPTQVSNFEFLLFDGYSNMVLASAMEPLRDVGLRALSATLSWSISTLDGQSVRSSSGINVTPDHAFDPAVENRTLVLVSGYRFRDLTNSTLLANLRQACRNADKVLALDTATWLLASAGVLDGHLATIHWQELDALKDHFPRVKADKARYVRSGKFITCGGASTALDMILDLIGETYGAAAAFDASSMFVYDLARQSEQGRGARKLRENGSPQILMALNVMAENVETPLTTFEIAKQVGLSERSLNRAFSREIGITPGKYFQMFRLQRARNLAEETNLSAEQIALRCGYSSAASLVRSFQDAFGQSIKEVRKPKRP